MTEAIEDRTEREPEQALAYHVLRYVPNLVRDEWVNIGVLIFNPQTGERRLRLIEEQDEFSRVRRLHPSADEALLRALRDHWRNGWKRVAFQMAEIAPPFPGKRS
jgi:hypothetical protein